ncbi:MAG: twin-arginine translocase subunit TatC [Chloroflexota bacterium]
MTTPEYRLTVLGHLQELRSRLIKSVIALAITTVICFIFYPWLFYILEMPIQGTELIAIELTERLSTIMRVSIFGGVILAMPYLVYHAIMFITPALTQRERRYVYLILPWIALMFTVGVVFGYFVILPPAIRFLFTWGSEIAVAQIRVSNYINVVTRLLLAIGLVFEMPVISTFLARVGIIKPSWLSSKRRIAIIFAFIVAAIITPTFDPVNQCLVAIPLIVLYELSIWLAKLVYRKREEAAAAELSAE